ncbi:MAG: TIM barrel protein [Verrucomicrobiota bacterium]
MNPLLVSRPLSSSSGPVVSRRQALRLLARTGAACLGATEAWPGPATKKGGLGVCSISYALRWPAVCRGQASPEEIVAFIDHSATSGAAGVQTPIPAETDVIARIRGALEAGGLYLEGQVSLPKNEAEVERFEAQIRAAKEAGATVARAACLSGRRYETFGTASGFADFVRASERSLALAEPVVRKHRIRLAIENHKDWLVPDLLRLLQMISSEFVGACVDTGNSIALLEDPMAVVEAYAPFAFATHLKDMAVQDYAEGFLLAEVPLGDGFLDLPKMVAVLRRARPEVRFTLEMITRDPLRVPCLTPAYWAALPSVSGASLAATLARVRTQASRQPLVQISPLAIAEKLKTEDEAVRRSIRFARERLDL